MVEKSVTFVIPALNAEATIERCLKSIAVLDYPKDRINVIVVDNGSKDDTAVIARKLGAMVLESGKKVSGMRNAAASKAKGEVIAFMDSDCVIPKDWLKAGIPYFDDEKVALAGSKTHLLADNATWVEKTWKIHLDRDNDNKTAKWFGTAALLVRRDVFLKVGGFDESLVTCEDVELGYKIGREYKIVADPKLAYVHLGEDKTLREFFRKETWRGKSGIEVALKNLREPKEALNLAFLSYYLVMIFVFFPISIGNMIVSRNIVYPLLVLAGLTVPIIAMAFDTCRRTGKFSYFGKLFTVYFVYILARVAAIFR